MEAMLETVEALHTHTHTHAFKSKNVGNIAPFLRSKINLIKGKYRLKVIYKKLQKAIEM